MSNAHDPTTSFHKKIIDNSDEASARKANCSPPLHLPPSYPPSLPPYTPSLPLPLLWYPPKIRRFTAREPRPVGDPDYEMMNVLSGYDNDPGRLATSAALPPPSLVFVCSYGDTGVVRPQVERK